MGDQLDSSPPDGPIVDDHRQWTHLRRLAMTHALGSSLLFVMVGVVGVAFRQASSVYSVALSPDGKYLARSENDDFEIVDLAAKSTRCQLHHRALDIHFSPDSSRLLFMKCDNARRYHACILIPSNLTSSSGPEGDALDVSSDGRLLAVIGGENAAGDTLNRLVLWQIETEKDVLTTEPFPGEVERHFRFQEVRFSPDGKYLAVGGTNWRDRTYRVSVLRTSSGERVLEITGNVALGRIVFSPNSERLAIAGGSAGEGQFVLVNVRTAKQEVLRKTLGGVVSQATFSPDGQFLSLAHRHLEIWRVKELQGAGPFPLEEGKRADDLRFSQDGERIWLATESGPVFSWEIANSRWRKEIWEPSGKWFHSPMQTSCFILVAIAIAWIPLRIRSNRLQLRKGGFQWNLTKLGWIAIITFELVSLLSLADSRFLNIGRSLGVSTIHAVIFLSSIISFVSFLGLRIPFKKYGVFAAILVLGVGFAIHLALFAKEASST